MIWRHFPHMIMALLYGRENMDTQFVRTHGRALESSVAASARGVNGWMDGCICFSMSLLLWTMDYSIANGDTQHELHLLAQIGRLTIVTQSDGAMRSLSRRSAAASPSRTTIAKAFMLVPRALLVRTCLSSASRKSELESPKEGSFHSESLPRYGRSSSVAMIPAAPTRRARTP